MLKLSLYDGEQKRTLFLCVCPFKCKWVGAPSTELQQQLRLPHMFKMESDGETQAEMTIRQHLW